MKSLHSRLFGWLFTFAVIGFSFAVIGCANMVDDSDSSSSDASGFPANVIVMTDVYNITSGPMDDVGNVYFDPNTWWKVQEYAMIYDPSVEIIAKANEFMFMSLGELPEKLDIQAKVYVYCWDDDEIRVVILCYFVAKTSKGIVPLRIDLRYDLWPGYWPSWDWTADYNSAVQKRNSYMKMDNEITVGNYVTSHCWVDGVRQY